MMDACPTCGDPVAGLSDLVAAELAAGVDLVGCVLETRGCRHRLVVEADGVRAVRTTDEIIELPHPSGRFQMYWLKSEAVRAEKASRRETKEV